MSNLYFLFLHKQRFIHTINLCINPQTGTIVIYSMETINSISFYFPPTGTYIRIPVFHHLTCIPTLRITHRWSYIEVLEQCKRSTDRYFMFHSVLPVLHQIGFEQKIIFRSNTVRKAATIAERNLLIPLLITYCIFPFERKNSTQSNIQIR